jgi:hypothetical protein
MLEPTKTLRALGVAGGLLATAPAAATPWSLDATVGVAAHVLRDEVSSPLQYGGSGGALDVHVAVLERLRHEVDVRAELTGLTGGVPSADATGVSGQVGWRFVPRLTPPGDVAVRLGPGLGLYAWHLGMDSVLNEHRTWAFGTELSVVAVVEAAVGAHDRLEFASALPLGTLVARPPYATTDEALRERSDAPLALVFTGRVGSVDAWARPQGTLRWVHDTGRVEVVTALDVSWLRASEPEPLRGWFLGLRAGVRVGGGER